MTPEPERHALAQALYEELCVVGLVKAPSAWRALPDATQDYYRRVARNLLLDWPTGGAA